MNPASTGSLLAQLREEEVAVVETAVRLAVDSVLNVLCGLSSSRAGEYQRLVGDRDREIRRLEARLREMEREQMGCCCRRGGAGGAGGDQQTCSPQPPRQTWDSSSTNANYERPSLRISFQSEPSLPSSPSRRGPRQSGTPHSSGYLSTSEAPANVPASPGSPLVKDEPCDLEKVFIQWEISQQEPEPHQEDGDTQESHSPTEHQLGEHEDRRNIRIRVHTPPDRRPFPQRQHLRMKKKSVPMSELSEEAQRLKRAAWRAASRRYYARKVARQQAGSAHLGGFSQVRDFGCAPVERRTLMQELPNDCPMLPRAAPAAFRHQQQQPAHLAQDTDWPEEQLEPNGGGGGIMCS